MKKIYLLAILAMGASSVFGQGKLDLRSLEVLRQYQAQTAGMQKTQAAEPKMVTAVVRLSSDNAVAALQKKGIEVLRQRDDLAIVQLPMDSVESVVASDALRQMQFSRPVRAKLDEANKSTGADKVHEGTDLDRAYTGESVIVSLIDQGIDPNHITFRKKGTTESRVKCLSLDSVERQTYSLRHTIEDFIVYVRPPHGNSRNTRGRHYRRQLHKQQRHF